jgi:hypothetical protein
MGVHAMSLDNKHHTHEIVIAKSFWTRKPYLKIVAMNGETVMHGETLQNHADAVATANNLSKGKFLVVDEY